MADALRLLRAGQGLGKSANCWGHLLPAIQVDTHLPGRNAPIYNNHRATMINEDEETLESDAYPLSSLQEGMLFARN